MTNDRIVMLQCSLDDNSKGIVTFFVPFFVPQTMTMGWDRHDVIPATHVMHPARRRLSLWRYGSCALSLVEIGA